MARTLGKKIRYLDSHDQHPSIWCPGCKVPHRFPLDDSNVQNGRPHKWAFNGNGDAPTFTPSMNVNAGNPRYQCHSFVTDGRIQFLGDCHHELCGQTVDLPDWPEEKAKYYDFDW